MTLTTKQLTCLTEKINARLDEFENPLMPKLTKGVVRMAYEVIAEWRCEENEEPALASRSQDEEPDDLLTIAYGAGYERGKQAKGNGYNEPSLAYGPHEIEAATDDIDPGMAAPIMRDGTVVFGRDPLPDPNVARDKIAHALANGSGGELAALVGGGAQKAAKQSVSSRPGNVLPTLDEVVRELRRQAMGGVMPSMAVFNDAKPGNWATAQAQALRLGLSWDSLATEAKLTPRRPGIQKQSAG